MKTCPVCQAVAFDDAAVCYGCLHRFGEGDGAIAFAGDESARAHAAQMPPDFVVRFTPVMDPSGSFSWTCAVE